MTPQSVATLVRPSAHRVHTLSIHVVWTQCARVLMRVRTSTCSDRHACFTRAVDGGVDSNNLPSFATASLKWPCLSQQRTVGAIQRRLLLLLIQNKEPGSNCLQNTSAFFFNCKSIEN